MRNYGYTSQPQKLDILRLTPLHVIDSQHGLRLHSFSAACVTLGVTFLAVSSWSFALRLSLTIELEDRSLQHPLLLYCALQHCEVWLEHSSFSHNYGARKMLWFGFV